MGTDIYAYIESKDSQGYSMRERLDLDRDYHMFALLAGVRYGYEPVYPPRGLPDDASDAIAEEYQGYGENIHTPSWLTADELERVFHVYNDTTLETGVPTIYSATLSLMRKLGDETRMIFWFDN